MPKSRTLLVNLIFFLHGLLIFLLVMGSRVVLPSWVEVIGRFHPALIHLPIGLFVFVVFLQFTRSRWSRVMYEEVFSLLTLLTSLTAVISAIMGLFLSLQGEYGPDDLLIHKYGGSVFSLLCFLIVLYQNQMDARPGIMQASTGMIFLLVVVTGHTGSVLTHGKNYLLAPLSRDGVSEGNTTAYGQVVEPILSKKCFSCHNASKAKGGLVMTSHV